MEEIDNWRKAIRSDQDPIQATSLNELASKLEVDQDALVKTLNTFNAACPKDLSIFNAKRPDGLATLGLEPRKSHWARPIDKPPYLAWPIISAVCFTFGGLKTNAEAQVLNMDGDVIPGLYAAGETMGQCRDMAMILADGSLTGKADPAFAAHADVVKHWALCMWHTVLKKVTVSTAGPTPTAMC